MVQILLVEFAGIFALYRVTIARVSKNARFIAGVFTTQSSSDYLRQLPLMASRRIKVQPPATAIR